MPNPVTDQINLRGLTGKNNTIHVYNTLGTLVVTKLSSNGIETMDAAKLPVGTYLVVVTNANGEKMANITVVKY